MTISRPRTIPPRRRPPSPRLGRVGTQGARAAFLATGPTAWYDARDLLSTSQQTLTNRVGTSTATLGSTGTSDTNDPVALTHSGTSYVWFPGTTSNNLSTPSTAALQITDDLDIAARVSLNDWTPAATQVVTEKFGSYALRVGVGGPLELVSNLPLYTSTANPTVTDGAPLWIRATRQRSSGDVKFYTAPDSASYPTSWTQLGATTGGSTAAYATNANSVTVGGGASSTISGALYRLRIGSTIDGAAVLDVNPAVETLGQSSWTCTTGQTVTVNRATSGLTTAVVTRPLLMTDGTDDYVQLPAGDTPTFTATTGEFTVLVVTRVHNQKASYPRHFSSEGASNNGIYLAVPTSTNTFAAVVGGATTFVISNSAAFTAGALTVAGAVVSNGTVRAYTDQAGLTATSSITGVGTITFASPRAGGATYAITSVAHTQCETHAVVTYNRALNASELASASAYLLGAYS